MKKASVIALILGILMLLTGVILPVILMFTSVSASAESGSVGIIGGADTPTFMFMYSQAVKGLPTVLAFTGLILIAASIVFLCIAKKKEN